MTDLHKPPKTDDTPDGGVDRGQALVLRTLDIGLSLLGLLLSAPLFPVLALLIKLDSKGPVLFPVERIGKDMQPFLMYKFRTMLESSVRIKQSICPKSDPRITAVGRFLRRTKLNELPQFFNILRGDMSFVGTRPEAPDLAKFYPEEAKRLLVARPGLVGPAVISSLRGGIHGRNEEDLYPPGVDPIKYYVEHILPEKLKIDLIHRSRLTVAGYLRIIFLAVKETIFGVFSARHVDYSKRQIFLFLSDMALGQASYAMAFLLYRRITGIHPSFGAFLVGLLMVGVARYLFYYLGGLYEIIIHLITPRDAVRVYLAVGVGSLMMLALSALLGSHPYPPLLALMDFALLGTMLTGVRLLLMFHFRFSAKVRVEDKRPRALIFGATGNGLAALRALGESKASPYNVVGFIDDREGRYGKRISGVRVLGGRHDIGALAVLLDIQEVVLAPDDEMRDQIDEIVALCVQAGVRSRVFSAGRDDEISGPCSYPLRSVLLADVLPHVRVALDQSALRGLLADRTVLMLGAGGQLGSSLCRGIAEGGGRKVVIVDRMASRLSEALAELRNDLPGFQIVPVVLDCRDIDALNEVFLRHNPQVVIHAGMRKFPTLQKSDPDEVARANYFRTFNLAKVAGLNGCEYFLMISSIKASRRGDFVSESLRVAELSLNVFFNRTPTRLIVTRIGNIIENQGGVVSWLSDQILEQKPLRLPAEKAKTYLLSKNAASRSILQGLVLGSMISPGGSLLTAEPGTCLALIDVAKKVANLYGLVLGQDIAVKYNGIPNGVIDDEPVSVIEASRESGRSLGISLGSDHGLSMMERVFSSDGGRLSWKELRQHTQEIISSFDAVSVPQKKELSVN